MTKRNAPEKFIRELSRKCHDCEDKIEAHDSNDFTCAKCYRHLCGSCAAEVVNTMTTPISTNIYRVLDTMGYEPWKQFKRNIEENRRCYPCWEKEAGQILLRCRNEGYKPRQCSSCRKGSSEIGLREDHGGSFFRHQCYPCSPPHGEETKANMTRIDNILGTLNLLDKIKQPRANPTSNPNIQIEKAIFMGCDSHRSEFTGWIASGQLTQTSIMTCSQIKVNGDGPQIPAIMMASIRGGMCHHFDSRMEVTKFCDIWKVNTKESEE